MGSIKEAIKLDKGFAEIRKIVAQSISPFGKATAKERRDRKARAEADLRFFAETYFPHYCTKPFSKMHEDMFGDYQAASEKAGRDGDGDKQAKAAPRGHAKSTLTTLIFPLWCIVTRKRRFGVIISDTTEQANEFLEFIKTELEVNERLAEDFPDACGESESKWAIGHIITRNGVKFRCYGAKKRMRGVRHGAMRPDLVIGDDLENDENVETHEQRRKLQSWFFKAVMKVGNRATLYIVVGTILHYDSLLSALLKRVGWDGKKYQAVIRFAAEPKLWEQWEAVFIAEGEEAADAFFKENRAAMLEGAEVLWPQEEDYYYLMKMRLTDGPAYFDSEKQNEPINPDDCLFSEDWFEYVEDEEVQQNLNAGRYTIIAMGCDPSMGKKKRTNDPSAIIVLGKIGQYLDVIEADIARRHPNAIMERLFEYHLMYRPRVIGIEEVQFQELFKDLVLQEGAQRGVYLPIQGVRPHTDKVLRVTKLQPHIRNGIIRFRRKQRTLLDQLKYFPKADHDDGPDGLEQTFSLIEEGSRMPRLERVAS